MIRRWREAQITARSTDGAYGVKRSITEYNGIEQRDLRDMEPPPSGVVCIVAADHSVLLRFLRFHPFAPTAFFAGTRVSRQRAAAEFRLPAAAMPYHELEMLPKDAIVKCCRFSGNVGSGMIGQDREEMDHE